ncbi:MAG: hypothetical protein ABSE56_03690 [Bryobacteraceae bacterium]
MTRHGSRFLAVAALVWQVAFAFEPSDERPLPRISISLPPDVLSETVDIHYVMSGPFGGYGGFVRPQRDVHAYEIEAAVDGKLATGIKIIVYAPGCEIATFDEALSGPSTVPEEFTCRRLPSVSLSGKIVPKDALRGRGPEVAISYAAYWAHGFFGIKDGMVTMIPVATAVPDAEGFFQVQLPDFGRDPIAARADREGAFLFWLREAKAGNIITDLEPSDFRAGAGGLRIQSGYPPGLTFAARRR